MAAGPRVLTALFVVLAALPCNAQSRRPPPRHPRPAPEQRKPLQTFRNVVSLHGAVGKLGPFASAAGGLMYERFLGPGRLFSLTVPVSAYAGTATFKGISYEPPWVHLSGHTVGVGIHYHRFTPKRVLDFSLGLASDIGQTSGSIHKPDSRSRLTTTTQFRETYVALALQPALNFHTRRRLQPSIFGNIGYVVSGAGPYHPYAGEQNRVLVQMGIRLGVGF